MELDIFFHLREAYGTSTINYNRFEKAINHIKWDDTFVADGEYSFVKGKMIFSTPSLNPFDGMDWKPSAVFYDGSYIEF